MQTLNDIGSSNCYTYSLNILQFQSVDIQDMYVCIVEIGECARWVDSSNRTRCKGRCQTNPEGGAQKIWDVNNFKIVSWHMADLWSIHIWTY